MAKKRAPRPAKTAASSWWSERSKLLSSASKPVAKKVKPKSRKKTGKAKKGEMYYCEVCGSEIVCVEDSAGSIMCCEEPMCLV